MSTSVNSVNNHFPSAENGFATTTSSETSSGATTVEVDSLAGYVTGEVVVFVIEPDVPNAKQTFTGVVDTGALQITDVVWTAGSNQVHGAGVTVVDYATATHVSMISKGLSVEHNQDGTHKAAATVGGKIIANFAPSGMITAFAGAAAPTDWLLCDGSAVNRTTYADLFSAIGTTYGAGNGTTTFNVPDLQGKVPVGKNGATFNTLAGTGGSETQTLTTANLPGHTHTFSDTSTSNGAHNHSIGPIGTSGSYGITDGSFATSSGIKYTSTDGAHTHSVSGTTSSTGSGTAHNNLQPYLVINYIIKT